MPWMAELGNLSQMSLMEQRGHADRAVFGLIAGNEDSRLTGYIFEVFPVSASTALASQASWEPLHLPNNTLASARRLSQITKAVSDEVRSMSFSVYGGITPRTTAAEAAQQTAYEIVFNHREVEADFAAQLVRSIESKSVNSGENRSSAVIVWSNLEQASVVGSEDVLARYSVLIGMWETLYMFEIVSASDEDMTFSSQENTPRAISDMPTSARSKHRISQIIPARATCVIPDVLLPLNNDRKGTACRLVQRPKEGIIDVYRGSATIFSLRPSKRHHNDVMQVYLKSLLYLGDNVYRVPLGTESHLLSEFLLGLAEYATPVEVSSDFFCAFFGQRFSSKSEWIGLCFALGMDPHSLYEAMKRDNRSGRISNAALLRMRCALQSAASASALTFGSERKSACEWHGAIPLAFAALEARAGTDKRYCNDLALLRYILEAWKKDTRSTEALEAQLRNIHIADRPKPPLNVHDLVASDGRCPSRLRILSSSVPILLRTVLSMDEGEENIEELTKALLVSRLDKIANSGQLGQNRRTNLGLPQIDTMTHASASAEAYGVLLDIDIHIARHWCLRFPNDVRLFELYALLDSSKPGIIHLEEGEEGEEENRMLQQQQGQHAAIQAKLLSQATYTLSLSSGKAMIFVGTLQAIPSEPLKSTPVCLDGRLPGSPVVYPIDKSQINDDIFHWPDFHNGVAQALRLARESQNNDIGSTWIAYNRPRQLSNFHAGILMGLGLHGCLAQLTPAHMYSYLRAHQESTCIALLLGLSFAKRGSEDPTIMKMLSIHIPALLPPLSSPLNISLNIETAAIASLGFLHLGTRDDFVASVCHRELMRSGDVSDSGSAESSSRVHGGARALAAGIGIGLVCLGMHGEGLDVDENVRVLRASSAGPGKPESSSARQSSILRTIIDELTMLLQGDSAELVPWRDAVESNDLTASISPAEPMTVEDPRPMRSHAAPFWDAAQQHQTIGPMGNSSVDVNASLPGVMIALAFIYLGSNDPDMGRKLKVPATAFLLDDVRPDMLLLRVLCHSLIMWDNVVASTDWIQACLPDLLREHMYLLEDGCEPNRVNTKRSVWHRDEEARLQALLNCIAGAFFALGLKYAGTQNEKMAGLGRERILQLLKRRKKLQQKHPSVAHSITTCIVTIYSACCMNMAGTGDLGLLRIGRRLQYTWRSTGTYGDHMALSMSIGLLSLGGGFWTLKRTPFALACLVISFYPYWPTRPTDNRYHLQALRPFWYFAAEERCLRAFDVMTGEPCNASVRIHFRDVDKARMATTLQLPCPIPEIDRIRSLQVTSREHLTYTIDAATDGKLLRELCLKGHIFVQQIGRNHQLQHDATEMTQLQTHTSEIIRSWASLMNHTAANPHLSHHELQSIVATVVEWCQRQQLRHSTQSINQIPRPQVIEDDEGIERVLDWVMLKLESIVTAGAQSPPKVDALRAYLRGSVAAQETSSSKSPATEVDSFVPLASALLIMPQTDKQSRLLQIILNSLESGDVDGPQAFAILRQALRTTQSERMRDIVEPLLEGVCGINQAA
eukprot:Clim_evm22s5 gene=Clim_evmTU22s5